MCIETLQKHIRRCKRRKQLARPAQARANNASYHGKHADMWSGDRRDGNVKRDSKRLQSCGPSISGNVDLRVVVSSQRTQLWSDANDHCESSYWILSVSIWIGSFMCHNLERAVEPGLGECESQSGRAQQRDLLPNQEHPVSVPSEASKSRAAVRNHSYGGLEARLRAPSSPSPPPLPSLTANSSNRRT